MTTICTPVSRVTCPTLSRTELTPPAPCLDVRILYSPRLWPHLIYVLKFKLFPQSIRNMHLHHLAGGDLIYVPVYCACTDILHHATRELLYSTNPITLWRRKHPDDKLFRAYCLARRTTMTTTTKKKPQRCVTHARRRVAH